jgi:hypothetical protein
LALEMSSAYYPRMQGTSRPSMRVRTS